MTTELKKCPKCNSIMTLKSGKYGKFFACSAFPKCKTTEKYTEEKQPITIKPEAEFKPTPEQTAIFNAVLNTSSNLLIKAGPGCGKTRTLTELDKVIQSENKIIVAFNKKIVNELESRGVKNVRSINSLTLADTRAVFPRTRIDIKKIQGLIDTCGLIAEDERGKLKAPIIKLISLLDANQINYDDIDAVKDITLNNRIELEINAELIKVINDIDTRRINTRSISVDFDDTLRIARDNPTHCLKFDYVLVDEAQDLSGLNLAAIKNSLSANGRIIFVGDPYQSIYAFRGADSESLNNIEKFYNTVSLPLSTTFRIPKNIVTELNDLFPHIPLTSMKDGGEIINGLDESLMIETLISNESALTVCRNNAPLVKPCYELIRQGYTATIEGKDIGDEMINLILNVKRKYNSADSVELIDHLNDYFNALCEKYAKAENKDFLSAIQDQSETIKMIIESIDSASIDTLILKIGSLFSDGCEVNFKFSSIHKAKGLEHETIVLYKKSLIGKKAETETEKQQESNLLWVAMTRPLNKLIIID